MVTALARVEGRPVGVVANNPGHLAGAIDSDGADKAARFMQLCDAFDLPDRHARRHARDDGRPGGRGDGARSSLQPAVRHRGQPLGADGQRRAAQVLRAGRAGDDGRQHQGAAGVRRLAHRRVRWHGPRRRGAARATARSSRRSTIPTSARRCSSRWSTRMYEHGKAVNAASHFEIDDVIDPADTRRWITAILDARRRPRRHVRARSVPTSTPGRRTSMHDRRSRAAGHPPAVPVGRSRHRSPPRREKHAHHRHGARRRRGGIWRRGDGLVPVVPRGVASSARSTCCARRSVPVAGEERLRRPARRCATRGRGWRGNPMAKTALELAVWDCHARQLGVPLRSLLGGERTEIPVGASLGMNPLPETVESVARHVEQGYKRIKLKIEPGWDVDLLSAVRADFPDIELTVDANSAYSLDDIDVLRADRRVRLALHRTAAALGRSHRSRRRSPRTSARALCLDETLTSPARTKAALDLGACAVVNVKVGRVGGLAATQEDPRSVRRPRRADVVRRHARDRCRPCPQHPRRDHARASCIRATPLRPAAPTHATSPSSSSRRPMGSCRSRPVRESASPSIGPFLDTVTESVEVLRG